MTGIAINLELAELCLAELEREQLDEVVVKGRAVLSVEPAFGVCSVSGEVTAARGAYRDAAKVFLNNLPIHRSNVRTLMQRLKSSIAEYGGVDEEWAARIRSMAQAPPLVASFLTTVVTAVETVGAVVDGGGVTDGYAPPLRLPAGPKSIHRAAPFDTEYRAYDIPRYAWAFESERGDDAVERAAHLRVIADSLTGHVDRLKGLRDKIASAWSPQESEAAERFLQTMDRHICAVHLDTEVAERVAKALDSIGETLVRTKHEMGYFEEKWQEVTTDWGPEFWDHAAGELNAMAAERMEMTDDTVRDQRSGIVIPPEAKQLTDASSPSGPSKPPPSAQAQSGTTHAGSPGVSFGPSASSSPSGPSSPSSGNPGFSVPSLPGLSPVQGPVLAGGPMPVPISAGNPPSMLPIPPGVNSLVPQGGAWLLPGPGVGAQGRLLPMPQRPGPGGGGAGGTSPSIARLGGGPGGAAAAGTGVSPVGAVAGSPPGSAAAGGGNVRPGAGREKWEVRQGVNPVIDNSEKEPTTAPENATTTEAQDAEFDAWFRKTATPWQ